jgi:hypothetical protein
MYNALFKQNIRGTGYNEVFAIEDEGRTNNPIEYTYVNFYDVTGLPSGTHIGAMICQSPQLTQVTNVNDENLAIWKIPFVASLIDWSWLGEKKWIVKP